MFHLIRVTILFTFVGLFSAGCSKDGSSSEPNSTLTALDGVYWLGLEKQNGDVLIDVVEIDGTNVGVMEVYFKNGNATHGFYRKSVGTYSKVGDVYNINWTYETCDPVKTQVVTVKSTDPKDRINVTVGNTTLIYKNLDTWKPIREFNTVTMTEDVNCDLIPL